MLLNITEIRQLFEFHRIILYGAGKIAVEFLEILHQNELKPEYIVISGAGLKVLNGINIYNYFEKSEEIKRTRILVIIAVGEEYSSQIIKNLEGDGIDYVYYAEFDRNSRRYLRRLIKKTDKEIIDIIKVWNTENKKSTNEMDVFAVREEADEKKNKIGIIAENCSPRTLKIAGALKTRGYSIISFFPVNSFKHSEWTKTFYELGAIVKEYTCFEELALELINNNTYVIHVFTDYTYQSFDGALISHKGLFGKIIYDEYDVLRDMYKICSDDIAEQERYNLENADGVCSRGFEIDYLIEKYNYKVNFIHFPDYCGDYFVRVKEANGHNLSLCYVGGVDLNGFLGPFEQLSEKCREHNCHLHLYPSNISEDDLKRLDNDNPFLHLHTSIPYEDLLEEISQYDYGIQPSEEIKKCEKDPNFTSEKMIYLATNKFFDYLDAGLPVISCVSVKLQEMLRNYGVLLCWSINDYDFGYLRDNKMLLKKRVMKAREELRVGKHLDQMISFYRSVNEDMK